MTTNASKFSMLAAANGNGKMLQIVGLSQGLVDLAAYLVPTSYSSNGQWVVPLGNPLSFQQRQFSTVAAAQGNDGLLQVLGVGGDKRAYLAAFQDSGGNWNPPPSKYSGPLGLTGRSYTALVTARGKQDFLQVIGLGIEQYAFLVTYQDKNGDWHDAPGKYSLPLGGLDRNYTALATGIGNDGSVQVMGLGTNGQLYLVAYLDSHGNWNAPPDKYHGPFGAAGRSYTALATANSKGYLQLMGLGADGQIYQVSYLDHDGFWHLPLPQYAGPLGPAGRFYEAFATGNGADDYVEVVGLGRDGQVYLVTYIDPKGRWQPPPPKYSGPLGPQGVSYSALTTGNAVYDGNYSYLDVIGLSTDQRPHLVTYLDPPGDWHPGRPLSPTLANAKVLDVEQAYRAVEEHGSAETYKSFPTEESVMTHFQGMARYDGFDVLTHNIISALDYDTFFVVDRGIDKRVDSFLTNDSGDYPHPGGCQVAGDFLAFAVETEHGDKGVIYFYYLGTMTDGNKPLLLPARIDRGRGAGAVGMTAIGTATDPVYLVAVYDSQDVTIYQSNGLPLTDNGCQFTERFTAHLEGRGADNLCMATDVNDQVFLFAFTSTGGSFEIDQDWVGLHRVDMDQRTFAFIEERQMYTQGGAVPNLVHFRFGAGLRIVSPSRLEFYCSGRNAVEQELGINTFSAP